LVVTSINIVGTLAFYMQFFLTMHVTHALLSRAAIRSISSKNRKDSPFPMCLEV